MFNLKQSIRSSTATAGQAADAARRLEALARADREKIHSLKRATGSALRVHHELLSRPVTTSRVLEEATDLSHVTVNKSLDHLCDLGIVTEITGQKRNRVFSYKAYIDILNEGTELPTNVSTQDTDD